MHVHRRVAVQPTLPLGSERTDHTATRPSAYRFGTLDAVWQCETHCHSGPNVPPSYVHRRVAVWMTLPCTFTAEWQCNLHCHSGPSVPITLPLGHERPTPVRSPASGSATYTATRVRAYRSLCHSGMNVLPLYVHRRVAVSTRRQTPPLTFRNGRRRGLDRPSMCSAYLLTRLSTQE